MNKKAKMDAAYQKMMKSYQDIDVDNIDDHNDDILTSKIILGQLHGNDGAS